MPPESSQPLEKVAAAITINYWVGETNLDGVPEFRAELEGRYAVSLVRPRAGGLGGGLYQLWVEFVSQLTLAEAVRVLLEGAAYDLIKSGTNAFFIRPFLDAYKRFRQRNENTRLGIDHIRFVFQDFSINIERLPRTDVLAELERILRTVAEHFETLMKAAKKTSRDHLFEVHIPVFEDYTSERVSRFRTLLTTDETLDVAAITTADYLRFWGLEYGISESEVYDVNNKTVIHEPFLTEQQYWSRKMYRRKTV